MCPRVHQEDPEKLKATVTQAEKDRTVTGTATVTQVSLERNEQNVLIPFEYDYIGLSYTGDNLTGVVYKTGGSGGSTVATLALAYTGAVLDTITRT